MLKINSSEKKKPSFSIALLQSYAINHLNVKKFSYKALPHSLLLRAETEKRASQASLLKQNGKIFYISAFKQKIDISFYNHTK